MIFNLIKKRRSVFPAQYNDHPIKDKEIETILEAANWAPTHKRTEPWRFKVVRGNAKTRLADFMVAVYKEHTAKPKQIKIKKIWEKIHQSQVIIAICMQRDIEERLPEWEEIAATAMAVQNMWLGCTELRIGCYWSSPSIIQYMDEFFDLQKGEQCLGFLYMGNYDEPLEAGHRGPISDKVSWIND